MYPLSPIPKAIYTITRLDIYPLPPSSNPIQSFDSNSAAGVVSDSEDGAQTQRRSAPAGEAMSGQPLPARTVPDEILCFSCRTYIAGDSDDRYPNAHGVHPAEFKVELMVRRCALTFSEYLFCHAFHHERFCSCDFSTIITSTGIRYSMRYSIRYSIRYKVL